MLFHFILSITQSCIEEFQIAFTFLFQQSQRQFEEDLYEEIQGLNRYFLLYCRLSLIGLNSYKIIVYNISPLNHRCGLKQLFTVIFITMDFHTRTLVLHLKL